MAVASKVVTVDLGTSTLKVGEFGITKGGGLTLLRFGVAELGLDPNKEEERAKFITPTLTKLFKDHGIQAREVLLSISGQSVFMRFVKLPPVDPAQVEQVVTFEAQQNVPFPISEVTWDYQMMPNRGGGTEAEAVIVATKKDVIEAEIEAVERAGLIVKQVDIAPFALLNAFRYSETQTDECALIIDIGARSTNLVFVEKSSFWIRNCPIAGNQISQSICNELQEPFTAAETLKKGKGFVSLGGVYADPDDPDAARISKLIRSTMTRLHVDINRSIAFYRTTLGGSAPKRVYLTGGSSQLPYLDLFIADKLSLPVAYFNPLRNVNLGPSLNTTQLQENNCYTAELVGLALRETGSCPAEVILDAPTLATRSDKKRKQPYFFAALAAWALLFVGLSLNYYEQITLANQTSAALRANTQGLQTLAPAINKLSVQATTLQRTLDLAVRLGNQRNAWPQILSALNSNIPEGIWITELTPVFDPSQPLPADESGAGAHPRGPGGARGGGAPIAHPGAGDHSLQGFEAPTEYINTLIIHGLYHAHAKTQIVDSARLGDFINSLATLPYFNIDPKKTSETLKEFTTPETAPGAFAQKYLIDLKLKTPIDLKPRVAPMKKLSRFDLSMIIAFVVITLLGGGVWWYLSGLLQTAQQDVNDAKLTFDKYSSREVYLPTPANEKILQANIDLMKAKLDPLVATKLQSPDNKLSAIEKQDTVAWKHDLDQEVGSLNTLAKTHGVSVPPNFYYGFSRYLNQNPLEAQTVVLSKQLLAIEQIATILINAPVKGIHIIRRTDEESQGGSATTSATSEFLPGHSVESEGDVYTAYPFEIDFDATTDSFRKVIDDLTQSPYVFIIRNVSVVNSHPTSPMVNELEKMAGAPATPIPSVVNSSPGEVAAVAAASAHSDKGPQFLFGAEILHIKMRIDLIEWKGISLDATTPPTPGTTSGSHAPHNPPGTTPVPRATPAAGGI